MSRRRLPRCPSLIIDTINGHSLEPPLTVHGPRMRRRLWRSRDAIHASRRFLVRRVLALAAPRRLSIDFFFLHSIRPSFAHRRTVITDNSQLLRRPWRFASRDIRRGRGGGFVESCPGPPAERPIKIAYPATCSGRSRLPFVRGRGFINASYASFLRLLKLPGDCSVFFLFFSFSSNRRARDNHLCPAIGIAISVVSLLFFEISLSAHLPPFLTRKRVSIRARAQLVNQLGAS